MSMSVKIVLGKRSQELIEQYINLCPFHVTELKQFASSLDSMQLIAWLRDDVTIPSYVSLRSRQEIEFVLALLRVELLNDLLNSLAGENPSKEVTEEPSSEYATLKLILLALAGTLFAGCEGFDSITTMLGVLSLPSVLILIAGLAFSILSIVVFYSYDLIQVSKNLGVPLREAPKLLDIYLQQMNGIKNLRKKIEGYQLATLPLEELIQLQQTLVMLQIRFQSVAEASNQFNNALNSSKIQRGKFIVTSLAGLLFFGSGFFAGQSVAMFVAAFYIPAVLPTFWPVILFSTLVGIAAFALYWHLEQDGLNKLVSGWFGLDEDKIEQVCNTKRLDSESHKLELLKQKIISTARLTGHLDTLQNELIRVHEKEEVPPSDPTVQPPPISTTKIGDNIFSFHAHPKGVVPKEAKDDLDSKDTFTASCR
ncbi:hypothetical protein [Legionella fallonii]|uniref:Coiled-coil protein n=1 Tax=Legionella fallonii LLAP-10 TaxID=1212491 RepID=A0A098GBI5_9GAMM|nr:hypothetical protein [Legionella fallonii]CEG58841.1 conserved membrane protein of unknown function [Legionella fallonii LLAP-10]